MAWATRLRAAHGRLGPPDRTGGARLLQPAGHGAPAGGPFARSQGSDHARQAAPYDKIWDEHVVHTEEDGTAILYIDRHLVHEVTSPQAFEGLRQAGRKVWRVSSIVATADHNADHRLGARLRRHPDPISKAGHHAGQEHREFGSAAYFPFLPSARASCTSSGPEQGATLPGMTVVCGDSHTSTHGAFGALAHGIGTSARSSTCWPRRR